MRVHYCIGMGLLLAACNQEIQPQTGVTAPASVAQRPLSNESLAALQDVRALALTYRRGDGTTEIVSRFTQTGSTPRNALPPSSITVDAWGRQLRRQELVFEPHNYRLPEGGLTGVGQTWTGNYTVNTPTSSHQRARNCRVVEKIENYRGVVGAFRVVCIDQYQRAMHPRNENSVFSPKGVVLEHSESGVRYFGFQTWLEAAREAI